MKKLLYLFVISSLAAFSSCKKNEPIKDPLLRNPEASACGIKDPVNNLGWLKKIVQEAKKSETDKYLTIRMAEYNGDTYFESWLSYSSCMGCIIYDCGGSVIKSQNFTTQQRQELLQAMRGESAVTLWGMLY
ncbi:MAG: hypothetical protein ABS46_08870 [Cytophagaceae bacterium SCN 52-12]|nr:MAG: hypothetical protein ABS46_08870 [Cytophagaceae bacterium SCN 52-12]